MGYFSAKIGQGCAGENARAYGAGVGERNDRGDRLVQFCVENIK